jgi:hypothetical protein
MFGISVRSTEKRREEDWKGGCKTTTILYRNRISTLGCQIRKWRSNVVTIHSLVVQV